MSIQVTRSTSMTVDARQVLAFTPFAVRQLAIAALLNNLEVHSDMIGDESDSTKRVPTLDEVKQQMSSFRGSTIDVARDFLTDLQTSVLKELETIDFEVYVRRMEFERDGALADVLLELDVKPECKK